MLFISLGRFIPTISSYFSCLQMSTSAYRLCKIAVAVVAYIAMNKVEIAYESKNTTIKGPIGDVTLISS